MKKTKNKKIWSRLISKGIKIRKFTSNARDKFADFFELPQEIIKKTTKITIINNDNLLIEGYKNVVDYLNNYIRISGNSIEIIIDGFNLDIKEVTDEDLIIRGEIYSVNFKK